MRWACALMSSGCTVVGALAGVHVPTSGPVDRPTDCESALPDLDTVGAFSAGAFASVTWAVTSPAPNAG